RRAGVGHYPVRAGTLFAPSARRATLFSASVNAGPLKKLFFIAITVVLGLATLWAAAALYFDFPMQALRIPAAIVYLLAVAAVYFLLPPERPRILASSFLFVVVLLWWITIRPSNDRIWQADVAQTAWAELDGDSVTIHNYRQCDYR